MRYKHGDVEMAQDLNFSTSQSELFELAFLQLLHQGISIKRGEASEEERNATFWKLAELCCDLGIKEDYATRFARNRFWDFREEVVLTFHNYYAAQNDSFAKCRLMNKDQRRHFLMDEFLERNYSLRYNVMTQQTEYADKLMNMYGFRPLTERIRYEMRSRLMKEGISIWDSELKQRLESSEVRNFYPMEDFLINLPKWDKRPRIKKLAMTIPTTNEDWPDLFYRWFLSMVSHWMHNDPLFGNSIIPVLVGPQGCGKSQWIRSLLPIELLDYYHDGFDLRQKSQVMQMMVRYGLINIDEFDALSARQEPVLKNLIQLSEVHINGQPNRRFCSFIATSNHYDLTRDTSGSRRYIFVDITGKIRLNHLLSLPQTYAEAVYAIEHKERTYFTKSEEARMQKTNEEFREQDISEQLFLNFFEPLSSRDDVDGDQWLTAIEIYRTLEQLTKKDLGIKRANKFGGILRKYCGKLGSKRGKTSTIYHVRLKTACPANKR